MRFQLKLFLAALGTTVVALLLAGAWFAASMRSSLDARIEQTLIAEARLAAELLGRTSRGQDAAGAVPSPTDLDAEADRMGALIGARVTLIAPDGRVVGDSSEPLENLATMENHATRPEVVEAHAGGLGKARRASATLGIDMLYVAAIVNHPAFDVVRVALPLTDVRSQLRGVLTATLAALGLALVIGAAIAYSFSNRIAHRVEAIAGVAERYRRGDLMPSGLDFGDDELGIVARALDESIQELGRRLGELARDRGRMEAILTGMVEGVLVVDPQGRVQLANEAARQMLRLDDMPNPHYLELVRHPAIAELIGEALAGRTAEPMQLSPPRDASRTIMARSAPTAYGAVMVLHDITELKRADQIRRDFVANVSHELRTPLTAIRGYVEALTEGDVSAEETRRFLAIILRHSLQMERLVKDLLRLARLDAGQEALDVVPCETQSFIQSVVADVQPSLTSRDQTVKIDVQPGAELALIDPSKLHDALRNLVANASTYAPAGSTIAITAAVSGTILRMTVADEGPGIPEEDLSRVFERFYRVDKSRGRDPGGTGLGLAIVKHLVELHGGSVRAANVPTGGAIFTIELKR
ncbi:MAG TPA: ATP-binding protein [Vicinamibacterales bacterium]|nr:ATP-binding protein [Vicinamibacterales bacterium]